MKRKNLICVSIVVILITAICGTYKVVEKSHHINSYDFVGTYELKADNADTLEYINIFTDDDIKKDSYALYKVKSEKKIEGKCEKTDKNYAVLFKDDGSVLGNLVHLNGEFLLIMEDEDPIEVNKISDEVIIP